MSFYTLRVSALALVFVALLSAGARAQEEPRPPKQDGSTNLREPKRPGYLGSPEEEMLRRAAIRHEEETHKEMVERADEAEKLGDELLDSFKRNKSLTRDDLKKLERLEKLVRKIRGGVGGSDDNKMLEEPPGKIESAVSRIAELSGLLKKSVLKTSRMVISVAVIERSNELIELIRHLRGIKNQ